MLPSSSRRLPCRYWRIPVTALKTTSRARMRFEGTSPLPTIRHRSCNGRVIDVERPSSRPVAQLPTRPGPLLADPLPHEPPREVLRAHRGLTELPREGEPEIPEVGNSEGVRGLRTDSPGHELGL